MDEDREEFLSSELGTKEYWDSTYERELKDFSSHGNFGDIWFGEESVERVLTWLLKAEEVTKESTVLDVGCGNGVFLLYLGAEGFTRLYGIDYSENAVKLATAIAIQKKIDIIYEQVDLLSGGTAEGLASKKYNVVHDKGTYDAVSLNPEDSRSKRLDYIKAIHRVTEDNGIFIITSCNWTKDDLEKHFNEYFSIIHIIETPTFMFGGRVGAQVSCIVFKKVYI